MQVYLKAKPMVAKLCPSPLLQIIFCFSIDSSQWLSASLMLWPFNLIPHAVVTSDHKIILLLLHNCSVATVLNRNVNICYAEYLIYNPCQTTG